MATAAGPAATARWPSAHVTHDSPAYSRMPRVCAAAAGPPPTTVDEGRLWAPAGRQEAATAANGRCMRIPAAANGAAASGSMGGVRVTRRTALAANAVVVGWPLARRERASLAPLGGGREITEIWRPERP